MIFHITTDKDWQTAKVRGSYRAPSLDSEGFIHCSTREQVLPVAENFYKGQEGLILLVIDPELLEATLKWEPPAGGGPPPGVGEDELFPHIYGEINIASVIDTLALTPDSAGTFSMPAI